MNKKFIFTALLALTMLTGCEESQTRKDSKQVAQQQGQYAKIQPVPYYNWSLERHLITELYNARNTKAATHSVWRSNTGVIEGDCPSMGFSLPYDTSLTNPLKRDHSTAGSVVLEQAEPNGIFASKNTAATWVLCLADTGAVEPIYVETKVTVYPYTLDVNYSTNRVIRTGESSVVINTGRKR